MSTPPPEASQDWTVDELDELIKRLSFHIGDLGRIAKAEDSVAAEALHHQAQLVSGQHLAKKVKAGHKCTDAERAALNDLEGFIDMMDDMRTISAHAGDLEH